ncbi:TPA: hypothetical protein DEP94_02480 [Candidatus Nomurabacteria bacterium]|nr:hypothetical protein [Candidatus Nomurabacteria bacterium]
MTINEIQLNVDQLKERHPKLNEELMSTLLLAGGWDESSIKEAVMLFKSGQINEKSNLALPHQDNVSLLELPKLSLLEEKKEDKEIIEETQKESLVTSLVDNSLTNKIKVKATLPDDLPLKPFEASHNIWTFSRYKDIFHGNEKEEDIEEKVEEKKVPEKEMPKVEVAEKEEKIIIPEQKVSKVEKLSLVKVPITKEDERIILTIGMLLLIVVILVIYMYLNGRI